MSLTQHLHHDGPLRAWWASRTAALQPYIAEITACAQVRAARLSQPGPVHAAAVGGVVGRLIETLTEPAPPYAAILGCGRRADATRWSTHAALLGTQAQRAVEWRPTPHGWQHLVPSRDVGTHSATLHHAAEVETSSEADVTERASAAAAVTALESAYRSGRPVEPVTPEAVADAVVILQQQRRALQRARQLCGGQLAGHAAPVLAPHWADGDLLLGPGRTGGYGLLDVKTVGRATTADPARVQVWLWQLLSYAAADATEDLWRIRAVGLWLPRQDALLCWPVNELWHALGTDPAELAGLLQRLYHRDARTAGLFE